MLTTFLCVFSLMSFFHKLYSERFYSRQLDFHVINTNHWDHVFKVSTISPMRGHLSHKDSSSIGQLESLMNGKWRGLFYYDTGSVSAPSSFTLLADLESDLVHFVGSGRDTTGIFAIQGHVHDNNRFSFAKSYPKHSWTYSGSINREDESMS